MRFPQTQWEWGWQSGGGGGAGYRGETSQTMEDSWGWLEQHDLSGLHQKGWWMDLHWGIPKLAASLFHEASKVQRHEICLWLLIHSCPNMGWSGLRFTTAQSICLQKAKNTRTFSCPENSRCASAPKPQLNQVVNNRGISMPLPSHANVHTALILYFNKYKNLINYHPYLAVPIKCTPSLPLWKSMEKA